MNAYKKHYKDRVLVYSMKQHVEEAQNYVSSQLCYSQYTAVEGWQMLFVGQICENMPHSPSCWECNQLETIMY